MEDNIFFIKCAKAHRKSITLSDDQSIEEFLKNNTCKVKNCGQPIHLDTYPGN